MHWVRYKADLADKGDAGLDMHHGTLGLGLRLVRVRVRLRFDMHHGTSMDMNDWRRNEYGNHRTSN